MKFLFFFSFFLILYVYLGYPLLISALGLIRGRKVKKVRLEPFVTVLISAFNEEKVIEQTLRNKLEQEYPVGKLEVVVISDGSTDRTDEIVRKYEGERVRLTRQEPRGGKTSALNMAVPQAKGEIIAFSDANSIWAKDALAKLVANFADPGVGYVTGKMIYTNPDGTPIGDGCTAYMKYENLLRRLETRLGAVVGVDGGVDAVRKVLYKPMNPDQLPDFVLPLKVVEQGYRAVYEPGAVLMEPALKEARDEYRMRVRVSLRSLWALWDMRRLLSFSRSHVQTFPGSAASSSSPSDLPTFPRSVLFTLQLWSHKVLRYMCFMFLIVLYFSNLALWGEGDFYRVLFVLQNMAYLSALAFPILEKTGRSLRFLYLPHYFALLNLASAHAFLKFIMGKKQITWTPRTG